MKSVLIGGIAAIVIAIAAGAVLQNINETSAEKSASSNARVY